ncbi:MAG: hypothetical protein ABL961_10295 [Vicinamibacterales bacterium]
MTRFSAVLAILVLAFFATLSAQSKPAAGPAGAGKPTAVPRTPWGHPDLQGVWSTATVTPFERPKELADKATLTAEEAVVYAKKVADGRNVDLQRQPGKNSDVTSAYNEAWYDRGTRVIPTMRTSLVVDPPDGRIPPLTPDGQARVARAIPQSGIQQFSIVGSWLERGIWERCITRGVPDVMLPTAYNNNYQIFQTKDNVTILAEMIHDARIIPLDGRPHLAPGLRQWMGDPRGHWEGDTLVVDTTNFTNKTTFRGSSENLHLIERFTRTDKDTLTYRATIEDPTTFTKPWTIEMPAVRLDADIYEYACHEGNYGMSNLLSASRAAEKEAAEAEAAKKK